MTEGAILNISRFVADAYLSLSALRREIKAAVAGDAEIERRYREFRRLWQRAVGGGRVGERSNKARTVSDFYSPLLRALGFEGALKAREVDLDPERVSLLSFDDGSRVLVDALPYAFGPDDRVPSGEFRGSAQRRMERALAACGARFGLILGGTRWRIVQLDTANEPRYLEFDLDMLADDDLADFGVFATIISPAFLLGESPELDTLLEKSDALGTEVSDKLGPAARRALERLLEGVRSDGANAEWAGGTFVEGDSLQQIHREGVYVLYRLLFVLFGESAVPPALPLDKPLYRDAYSLERLRLAIAGDVEEYAQNGYGVWESVKALFRLIDRGASTKEFHIPAYNGGLFGPGRTPQLDRAALNDRAFVDVLRELTTIEIGKGKRKTRDRVSFRELGVAQLGAVFEGLLDFEPHIAAADLLEVAIAPEEATPKRAGEFYLQAWGEQRKSTGAYYTPKVIADYLVREVLGPQAADKSSDEILEITVCDPAMGSGGFLVSATEFLGDAYYRAQVREGRCDPDVNERDDRVAAKRIVAERCMYGVDMNPMAVELAKVSLWLATLSYDRPLSFFDHHLRCGNSLLSAPLRDKAGILSAAKIQSVPQAAFKDLGKDASADAKTRLKRVLARNAAQLRAFERGGGAGMFSLDLGASLEQYAGARKLLSADDPTQQAQSAAERIRGKERQLRELTQDSGAPFFRLKTICDLWMAPWFWPSGSDVDPPTTDELQSLISDIWEQRASSGDRLRCLREIAANMAAQGRFFHWELEFPEVFENGGFSAILGNPPYTAAYSRESRKSEQAEQLHFVAENLSHLSAGYDASSGRQNTFVNFTVLSERLAMSGATVGLVLPDPVRTSKSYLPLRYAITKSQRIRRIVAFREVVFKSASVESCLVVFDREIGQSVNILDLQRADELAGAGSGTSVSSEGLLSSEDCRWLSSGGQPTLGSGHIPLGEVALVKDGINPGAASVRARLFTKSRTSSKSKMLIEGKDVTEFRVRWSDNWVDYDESSVTSAEKKAGTSLRKAWIFSSPKLVYRQTASTLIVAVDLDGYCTTNSVHNVILKDHDDELLFALASYLNSKAGRESYRALFGENRMLFPQVHISDVKRLPLPKWVIESGRVRSQLAALARHAHASDGSKDEIGEIIERIDKLVDEQTP